MYEIMQKDLLLKKSGRPDLRLVLRRCRVDELDKIVALEKSVMRALPDPELYAPTKVENFMESLEKDYPYGVFDGNRLVAYSVLLALRATPRNLARYAGYSKEECLRCTTNDGTFVDPEYRGYGIQNHMIKENDIMAKKIGAEEIFISVSPKNTFSYTNIKKNGYKFVLEKQLYGGYGRHILNKCIH